MVDSDTEYIAEEPFLDNKEKIHQLLTTNATVHVEGEVLDTDELPAKKLKKKVPELNWKFVKAKKCSLEANVLFDIPENANPLLIFKGTTNLNELVKHIFDETDLYATQRGEEFATNSEEKRT